jgi:hypothetical protein
MANKTSPHILGTAANLLGFCLIVLTSLHLNNHVENIWIHKLTCLIAVCLTLSSLLSFISIRTARSAIEAPLEKAADYLFGLSLVGVLLDVVLIAMELF